ncbi:MBL fold metallo-hydrolase [uncultured Eudoraea sp.]|uniref:MBL fold metallo-hydrolase n=1 Tax=uncultured Eudoraea sp. TaxID=1035614 RepID=UPI0026392B9B|nr:MBL fold metallo-hydrolase [uncultured Eudoraea sp.]
MRKQFGARTSEADIQKYQTSKHWSGSKFENLEETSMDINFQTLPKLLYKQFCEKKGREPKAKLDIKPFNKNAFLNSPLQSKFIWYGHSSILMRHHGRTILIDPMFGPNAAPIAPFPVKRFSDNTLDLIEHFPEIDLLLMSHDHYDHLDLASIQKLKPKVKHYFVALGVARHLVKWGIPKKNITEFDWWTNQQFEDITITFTPTRHFSGRGLTDRAKSLWGGWAFKTAKENIWFSGDSGYGSHFKDIGKELGPFDFGFMECGQYNENWQQIHMYPEESVQAALDAGVSKIMPVHWGGFALAQHSWKDPVDRFVKEAERLNISVSHPALGGMHSFTNELVHRWWDDIQ